MTADGESKALMDAALMRRLRNHADLRKAGLTVDAMPDGQIAVMLGDHLLGFWCWEKGGFAFRREAHTEPETHAGTLYGVVLYLATLIDVEQRHACRGDDEASVA